MYILSIQPFNKIEELRELRLLSIVIRFIMFKGKRFKQQPINHINISPQQKLLPLTASSNAKTTAPRRRRGNGQHENSLAPREVTPKGKMKRFSLQHRNNPEQPNTEQNNARKKQQISNKIRRKLTFKGKETCTNLTFSLKIKQSKEVGQVTPIMRIIIIDWLMELVHELDLSKQALHNSISYLDRLLHKIKIGKDSLQIYALCSLMIAQKLESQRYLTPAQASQLLKNQVSERDLILIEQEIVRSLEFKLQPFTLWVEINIILKAFESYFKEYIHSQWQCYKHKMLWVVEGIIMENSYFGKEVLQKEICISLLYSLLLEYDPALLKHFPSFCKSLTGSGSFSVQQMQPQLRYLSPWLSRKCCCPQAYSPWSYHPQLKIMAASAIYN